MFFGLGLKAIMISGAVIMVTGAATAAVVHYKNLVSDRAQLEGVYEQTKSELISQQDLHAGYVASANQQLRRLQADLTALSTKSAEERKRSEKLSKLFGRHNFAKLATKKPGLLSTRINRGTDRMWLDLESSTRREPRGREAGAESGVPATGSD